jgi:hypothetical protein
MFWLSLHPANCALQTLCVLLAFMSRGSVKRVLFIEPLQIITPKCLPIACVLAHILAAISGDRTKHRGLGVR